MREGGLGAGGLTDAVRSHRPLVDPVGDVVEEGPAHAEALAQLRTIGGGGELGAGTDPEGGGARVATEG